MEKTRQVASPHLFLNSFVVILGAFGEKILDSVTMNAVTVEIVGLEELGPKFLSTSRWLQSSLQSITCLEFSPVRSSCKAHCPNASV